jgi:hypothetical protein
MLEKGLTEDGTAQALGWPKARVTARVKLLELPEKARELVGAGAIPLSAVDQLSAIGSPRDAPAQSITRGPSVVRMTLAGWKSPWQIRSPSDNSAKCSPASEGERRGDAFGAALEKLANVVL